MTTHGKKTIAALLLGSTLVLGVAGVAAAAGPGGQGGFGSPRDGMGPGMGPNPLGGAVAAQFDFATLDADGSGTITLDDIDALAKARFGAADTNGDGQLDTAEIAARITAQIEERGLEPRTEGGVDWTPTIDQRMVNWMAEGFVIRMDADGNGTVSMAEATPKGDRMARLIDRFDTDGDGGLSQAEFDAAKAKIADRGGRGDHAPRGGKTGRGG